MEIGVFIPIGNNGWLISTTSPQYMPTFELNQQIVQKAEQLRARLRPVDDQAARLRRQERVLGPQSRILHPDGRPGRGHRRASSSTPRCAVLTLPPAIAARMAVDHRFDLARPLRQSTSSPAGRGASTPRWACGRATSTSPSALRLLRRIRHHPARAVGDGAVRLQGRDSPDGRLQAEPTSAGRDEDRLRRPERRAAWSSPPAYGDYNFCARQGRQHADRASPRATQRAGGGRRQDRPRRRHPTS